MFASAFLGGGVGGGTWPEKAREDPTAAIQVRVIRSQGEVIDGSMAPGRHIPHVLR